MPAYAGILQGVMTLMLATRLVLRAQLKAGPLGLDDVSNLSTRNELLLMARGFAHTFLPGSNNIHCPDHTWHREVWHGPSYMGRQSNDV